MQRWMFEQEPLYAYGNALLGRTYCTCKQPGHLVLTYWAFACLLLFLWLLDFFFFFFTFCIEMEGLLLMQIEAGVKEVGKRIKQSFIFYLLTLFC